MPRRSRVQIKSTPRHRAERLEQRFPFFGNISHDRPKPTSKGGATFEGHLRCSMGRKSDFHYTKCGKFAKAASLLHPGCHQGPNRTAFNRYPEVFAAAAAAAPDARRILSFGCSSGEECVTLADYLRKPRSSAPTSIQWSCCRPGSIAAIESASSMRATVS